MPVDESLAESRRVLEICNACGYCNGFCDVFESAERRPTLNEADLVHLANLCHACRNCFHGCQYAPPHPFLVNVPRSLARTRYRSYLAHAWPAALSGLLARQALAAPLIALGAIALLVGLVLVLVPPEVLFASQAGAGAFYRILSWEAMVLLGGLPLGWSVLAIGLSLRQYWRLTRTEGAPLSTRAIGAALRDILVLRNLRGGGPGCNDLDDRFSHARRRLHHAMLHGFLLSFAATVTATLYHHLLGWEAPYPLLSAPVLLGTLGGILMSLGAVGLAWMKWRADPEPSAPETRGLDLAFLGLLFLVAVTGLALLVWRETAAMGLLLAIHLGSVLAFFLLLPYSKFVHAGYRAIALLIEAIEHAAVSRQ
ncbi:tricarballylate utilization 4Fe-4S protein TcuB [Thiocystis violacea]|uniref:tricarballylate utilization 4Fe-4S protein TcuB n=1 Tax=Thiocystis violacea TaxID=13725 RepID=UPI001907C637|nr:tricarballylate utilization 4Fe-4S protein TcuB [Thiocystis violacea]MBK1718183.1 signal transduction protein [Thiocystis violacea]